MNYYAAKSLMPVTGRALLARPSPVEELHLTLDSPAQALFTDFTQTQAVSVPATTQIDEALQQMIVVGVRLLFVTDADFHLVGAITSYDIAGEKPLQYLQSRDTHFTAAARETIQVQHIMRPVSTWHVLDYQTMQRAVIGDIIETFKHAGQQHIVVVEELNSPQPKIRGLLSARHFQRALGISLEIWKRSDSFAEIERVLDHPLPVFR